MKNIHTFLVLILFCAACESPPEQSASQTRLAGPVAQSAKPDIPLNESLKGASVSTARNFYVVFDGSGSMADSCKWGDSQRKIEGAKWALQKFLDKVPADANLGLYVFDAHSEGERVPLGQNNREQFIQQVNAISSGGGTPLAAGIQTGADRLITQYQRQLGYGEYRLVVVTDGEANAIPEAIQYAWRHRFAIPIYAIGFCIEGDHPLRAPGVFYRDAGSSADLARGLEETLAELETFQFKPEFAK